jgi:hypothetical protein
LKMICSLFLVKNAHEQKMKMGNKEANSLAPTEQTGERDAQSVLPKINTFFLISTSYAQY